MQDDSTKTRLLLWDEADVRSRLAEVLVAPVSAEPDADAVYGWLEARCEPGEEPEAAYFTSVPSGAEEERAGEVTRLRELGYEVHVRPGRGDGRVTDMAPRLANRLRQALDGGSLSEVVVASHDASGLVSELEAVAAKDIPVTVLGLRERASFAVTNPALRFVDLEDVPGAFSEALPRTNLYDLPEEGRVLAPLRRRGRAAARPTPSTSTSSAPAPSPAPAAAPAPPPAPARAPWSTTAAPATSAADAGSGSASTESAEVRASNAPEADHVGSSLDDLLAGIRPSPLSSSAPPPPARPGRVAPPNGTP